MNEFSQQNHQLNTETVFGSLSLAFLSTAQLYLYLDIETPETLSIKTIEKIHSFFSVNDSRGLLRLGLNHFEEQLPESLFFWRKFSQLFITELCKHNNEHEKTNFYHIKFPTNEIDLLIGEAPFTRGMEYFNYDTAVVLWENLNKILPQELEPFNGSLNNYLSAFNPSWNTVGKLCFHLAENKNNSDYPFAFLATYTTGLSSQSKAQHLPLGKALEEYAGKNKTKLLLALLLPIHQAAENSLFLKNLLDTGKIFSPQAFVARDAHEFLKNIHHFETAGIMIRVPNWWNAQKPSRPNINVTIGKKEISQVGLNALLDFEVNFSLPSGETLTEKEFKDLLNNTEQFVQIKGQWVQIDNEKLNHVLLHWKTIEKKIKHEGLSFSQGLRLLSGLSQQQESGAIAEEIASWSNVVEGEWLQTTLSELRNPLANNTHTIILQKYLQAQLRPYQEKGVYWLWWLYNMNLGGCLADDMGLGKTIQVISLLLLVKYTKTNQQHKPHLLVLPASLVGNWQAEIIRFAPSLSVWIAHSSNNKDDNKPDLSSIDLVITTYGTLSRLTWLSETNWSIVILDEAQAIKNPSAKQTKACKTLLSNIRFVLTGTPIENKLLDLWSLFDFIAPGLLGTSRAFADYSKQKNRANNTNNNIRQFYAAVRKLVTPYILRRLKSDKRIINDLPDKTEMQAYCSLSKQQIGLYQQAVAELTSGLKNDLSGINRRGLVMSYILRFKQICNHPNQWLGHGDYHADLSGKFLRLQELCEIIADKQEKVLVFTQFTEIIPALTACLANVFKQDGLTLDGKTPIKTRTKLVEKFQQLQGPPFFILSLKAGGTGLNLTAASHVIHFDRWWNPAVENQATDRAFRIGQKNNVLVHKFICKGTIEEKIDIMINSKKALSSEIIGQENEVSLTELSNTELMNIVALDIHRALSEN